MALTVGSVMPDLSGATAWLNIEREFTVPRNVPVLIHFWATSCPSCHANMPHLRELLAENKDLDLNFIAIHMPRGPYDLDLKLVEIACCELKIVEPCAIDNEHILGERFQNGGVWPVYYLFGSDGKLKRRSIGGFGVSMMKAALSSMRDSQGR